MNAPSQPVRRRSVVATTTEGKVNASSQTKHAKEIIRETNESKSIAMDGLPPDPAYVRVGAGVTENLGNFESLRIDVSVTLPCGTSDAEIRAAKTRAADFVVEFIEDERQKALGTEGVTATH
jgi:hypothetical protein